jgi:IS30 family transposase
VLGRSITERPEHINDRSEFGHWEIDCVVGKKTKDESVLLTLTERKTHMEIIRKLPSKSTYAVQEALQNLESDVGDLFSLAFKSITADNGSEFSDLASFKCSEVYFAHPYSSCERGTNEHHNDLIRRFIPKRRSLDPYSSTAIETVQSWCKNLPRKILGYLTPQEAFEIEVFKLTS